MSLNKLDSAILAVLSSNKSQLFTANEIVQELQKQSDFESVDTRKVGSYLAVLCRRNLVKKKRVNLRLNQYQYNKHSGVKVKHAEALKLTLTKLFSSSPDGLTVPQIASKLALTKLKVDPKNLHSQLRGLFKDQIEETKSGKSIVWKLKSVSGKPVARIKPVSVDKQAVAELVDGDKQPIVIAQQTTPQQRASVFRQSELFEQELRKSLGNKSGKKQPSTLLQALITQELSQRDAQTRAAMKQELTEIINQL